MSWDFAIHGIEGRNPEMFAAVKAGVLGFSKCLARSYAPDVRVNDLTPGWIETVFAKEIMRPDAYERVIERTPLRRFGVPEDVARPRFTWPLTRPRLSLGRPLRANGELV